MQEKLRAQLQVVVLVEVVVGIRVLTLAAEVVAPAAEEVSAL